VEGDIVDREQHRVGVRDADHTTVLRHADDELTAVTACEAHEVLRQLDLAVDDFLEVGVRVLPPEDPLAKLLRRHRGHRTSPCALLWVSVPQAARKLCTPAWNTMWRVGSALPRA